MGLRDNNPFLDQDISNICNAYVSGANAQETEASVFAIFAPEIVETKSFATTTIDHLKSYNDKTSALSAPTSPVTGTGITNKPTFLDVIIGTSSARSDKKELSVAGIHVQNTALTIMDADSVGEALKAAAADCIPCADRILAIMNLNPLNDLKKILKDDIQRRLQVLSSLLDLLNNIDIFNDLCSLLRELNFLCVPDLQRIALLLTLLLTRYKQKLDMHIALPEVLIGGLFAPFLSGLNTLLDQYIQTIIAPIECIIDALNYQVQKLDVKEGIQKAKAQLNKDKKNTPTKDMQGSIPNISDPLKAKSTVPLKSALSALAEYLSQGKTYIDSSLSFLKEQLTKLLDTNFVNTKIKISDAQSKLHLLRLISLVISIISATKSGNLNCGDLEKVDATKKLETFLNNYIVTNTNIKINLDVAKEQVLIQSPKIPDAQSNIISEVMSNFKTTESNLPLTTGERKVNGQVVKQSTILIKNCLRNIDKQDLDKVTQWISDLK